MLRLNEEQADAVAENGDVIVTACPGSGKTRVLTARVATALDELATQKRRVVAMTFTNRATDEIKDRLDALGVDDAKLWAGTIHAFAIEWVLRPYAGYVPRLRCGFTVADEFTTERILDELRATHGVSSTTDILTRRNRAGKRSEQSTEVDRLLATYDTSLEQRREIDFDDALYLAYELLVNNPEVARTLASVIAIFCIDEIQDTQDLQFGILREIVRASDGETRVFGVGDEDQAIYESLGATVKTPDEIRDEFGLLGIAHKPLSGNYRSTQRIVNLYQQVRPGQTRIVALGRYAGEHGQITLSNQTVTKDDLPSTVARHIRDALDSGVPANDICIAAPQWWHVRAMGRNLVTLLPDVDFDAPGLSPLHAQRESIWFKISRLFLTMPTPSLYGTRLRWAWEVLRDLRDIYHVAVPHPLNSARGLLRFVNSIESQESEGLAYLRAVFEVVCQECGVALRNQSALFEAQNVFFEKAARRIRDTSEGVSPDVSRLRQLFRHPGGVVVDTCHGIKGEEYDTVIAFGLLRGYVPNWRDIIDRPQGFAHEKESKLLYVLCSRAKRRLHLIAESGRVTGGKRPYETSRILASLNFDWDGTVST